MRTNSFNSFLLNGALLGVAFLFGGCIIESGENTSVNPTGIGGSNNIAGAAGAAGEGGGTAGAAGGVAGEGGAAGQGGAAPEASADLRFVHLIPDLGIVDVCARPVGGSQWGKPLFASNSASDSFYYPGVSNYFQVDPGQWEIRLVAQDAPDCETPLPKFNDQTVSFLQDQSYSLIFEGSAAFTIKVTNLRDRGAPEAGKVGYQAHNALTSTGAVDFGLLNETEGDFYPLAQNLVPFTADGQGDFDPSTLRPTWLLSGTTNLVAQSPAVQMDANEIYAAFIGGTKLSDPTPGLRPAAILCRNYLTVDEKNNAEEYAVEGNIMSNDCLYGENAAPLTVN